jgi:multiple sugar transport system permease protein
MTNENFRGLIFVTPLLAGVLVFYLIPAGACALLSLFQWSLTSPPRFVGMENYMVLLGFSGRQPDPLFVQSLFNTFILALVVPVQVGGSFLLALFLSRKHTGFRLLRMVVFLPTLVSPVALYILWRSILFTDVGFANRVLEFAGITAPLWLEDPVWSKPAVMLVMLWEGVGSFQMLFFLAGLRQIPEQIHDMARLDGSGFRHRLGNVYWPWLKSLVIFNLCLGGIAAVQGGFEIAYIMTGGGPLRSTTTLSYFLFENAFQWQRMGYGAAVGMIMFFVITPLLLIRIRRQAVE